MKPTRIGTPYKSIHHGKEVTRTYVYFPDGSRELMKSDRLEWTLIHGRPPKGHSVFRKDGKLVCLPNSELSKLNGRKTGKARSEGVRRGWKTRKWNRIAEAARIYLDHKPYRLAA